MYDVPRDVTTFIHRAGRTARQGLPGVLTCLVRRFEQGFYNQLRLGEGSGSALQQNSGRAGREQAEGASALALQSPEQRAKRWSSRTMSRTEHKGLSKLKWQARMRDVEPPPLQDEPSVPEFAP